MKVCIYFLLLAFLSACSSKQAYNAIKHNQCLEKTGQAHCNEIEDYESYEQKRKALLKEPAE